MATEKQKRVADNLVENNGKSVSQAMKDAGYSEKTARNPQQLTRSNGWQELMDEYFPDDVLYQVHQEGLQATRTVSAKVIVKGGDKTATTQTDDFIDVPDFAVRHKYLDTAYELKGMYPAKKHEVKKVDEYADLTDEELRERQEQLSRYLSSKKEDE